MTSTLLEKEKVNYIKGMESYLVSLKGMSKEQAVKKSRKSLMASGIINKDGTLTENYKFK